MTLQEIESKISAVKSQQDADGESLKSLRSERAALVVNGKDSAKTDARVNSIDEEILKLRVAIDNSPSVLAELENQLAAENQRLTEKERENLLEQQTLVSTEIEKLSQKFINQLKAANETNTLLRNALSAYGSLQEKSGQTVLSNSHCQGSEQSLRRLIELMEYQMSGVHTAEGGGMVGTNVPIRL